MYNVDCGTARRFIVWGWGVWGLLSVRQRKGHLHGQVDYQHRNREFFRWKASWWSLRRDFEWHVHDCSKPWIHCGRCSWDLGRGIFNKVHWNSPVFPLFCLIWVSQFCHTFLQFQVFPLDHPLCLKKTVTGFKLCVSLCFHKMNSKFTYIQQIRWVRCCGKNPSEL